MAIVLNDKQLEQAEKWLYYKNNPIQFFEEQCYLPLAGQDTLVKLHKPQRKIVEDFYYGNVHSMIFLKSRQTGFSTLWQLISSHLVLFYDNIIIGITSRDGKEASDFCRKTIDILEKLDKWLRPEFKWKNVQDFSLKDTNSQFRTSAIPKDNPQATLRGKSMCLLIMDEIAHASHAEEAWTGIAPALSAAQKVAKDRNIPFGTVLLSTPNMATGTGKFFFDMWTEAVNGNNGFTPYKVHWSEVDAYKNDPDWYTTQCQLLNNNKRKILQELELQFVGDENTFLPEDVITELQKTTLEPLNKIRIGNNQLWKFVEKIDPKKFYLIGIDTSSSYGNDYSTIQVLDYMTMEQIMEYRGKVNVKEFRQVIKLVESMIPKNLLVIENSGGYGLTILEELIDDNRKHYNIFYEEKKDKILKTTKRVPGLSTNLKTRPLIIDALYNTIVPNPDVIKSERLKLELLSLVTRGGKVQTDTGANDDLVMAFAFCCYVRTFYKATIEMEEEVAFSKEGKEAYIDIIDLMTDGKPFNGVESQEEYELFKEYLNEKIKKDPRSVTQEFINESIYGKEFCKRFFR